MLRLQRFITKFLGNTFSEMWVILFFICRFYTYNIKLICTYFNLFKEIWNKILFKQLLCFKQTLLHLLFKVHILKITFEILQGAIPAVFAHSLQFERALAVQIIMLYPMAPFFAAELWSGFVSAPGRLNNSDEILWDKSVSCQKWPEADFKYNLDLVCQVNIVQVIKWQSFHIIRFPTKYYVICLIQSTGSILTNKFLRLFIIIITWVKES